MGTDEPKYSVLRWGNGPLQAIATAFSAFCFKEPGVLARWIYARLTGLQCLPYVESLLISTGSAPVLDALFQQRCADERRWCQTTSYGGSWQLKKYRLLSSETDWTNLTTDQRSKFTSMSTDILSRCELLCTAFQKALNSERGHRLTHAKAVEILSEPLHRFPDVITFSICTCFILLT